VVLELGISDFISQIDLPSLQQLHIIYPIWCNEQMHRSICKRLEDEEEGASELSTSSYDSEAEDSTPASPYIPKCSVEVCYREENACRFPNVVIKKIPSYNVPNVDSFDVVPPSRAHQMTDLEHIL
jgi:hypothetical protein